MTTVVGAMEIETGLGAAAKEECKPFLGFIYCDPTTTILVIFQLVNIILLGACSKMSFDPNDAPGTVTQGYNMFIGILIMMLVGFGYLMAFLHRYGVGAVTFTLMVTAMAIQWALFTEHFFYSWWNDDWNKVEVNIFTLMNTLFAVSSVLISFGAVIGKISPRGLIIMCIIELVCHSFNYKILMGGMLEIADMGGTYLDHMFGAYFGLTVAYILGKPTEEDPGGVVPDIFSLVGTVFLWIYWPSFVSGAAEADSIQQHRAIVATFLALSASTVGTFISSIAFNKERKFRPVDIQNATLAGGVAIGCVANLTLQPVESVLIGLGAGIISTYGYYFIQPKMESWGIHDSCGVHNLHGMPAVLGGIASCIIAAYKQNTDSDSDIYTLERGNWYRQFLGILVCILFAVTTGALTGFIIRKWFNCAKGDQYKESVWLEVAE
jgi:ammonium transporter Rh